MNERFLHHVQRIVPGPDQAERDAVGGVAVPAEQLVEGLGVALPESLDKDRVALGLLCGRLVGLTVLPGGFTHSDDS